MSSKTVKAARESLGLGQKAVAEYMGVPQSTISKIETGIKPEQYHRQKCGGIERDPGGSGRVLIREEPARISVDNGQSWATPEEAVAEIPWDVIVEAMDDRYREYTHNEVAPCSDLEFLVRYLEVAPENIIIG